MDSNLDVANGWGSRGSYQNAKEFPRRAQGVIDALQNRRVERRGARKECRDGCKKEENGKVEEQEESKRRLRLMSEGADGGAGVVGGMVLSGGRKVGVGSERPCGRLCSHWSEKARFGFSCPHNGCYCYDMGLTQCQC